MLAEGDPSEQEAHEIQELIGEGGMGSVWRVWDPRLARSVALKRVHTQRGSAADRRFVLEAQVTGRLQHPGIPPVYELGTDTQGRPYFTMRELTGKTLSALSCDLPLERKIQILVRVCDAVAYAHDQGVLHRDLKPANILIGDYGEVMVLDWGIAKLMDQKEEEYGDDTEVLLSEDPHLTQMGAVLGTVGFMSPEQACGDRAQLGPRSDVFSMGAMLFTMCTEEHLFDTLKQNQDGHFALTDDIPPELRAVLTRALAPQPEQRLESVHALGEELQAWLDGRPLASMQYSAGALLSLWAKRHQRSLLLGATLLSAATLLAGVGLAKYLQDVGEETQRAHTAEHLAQSALARTELARGQALLAAQQPHLARASLRQAVQGLLATGQDPTAAAMALWAAKAFSPASLGEGLWQEHTPSFEIERYGEGQPQARLLREGHAPVELGFAYDLWMNERYGVPSSYYEPVWLWDFVEGRRIRALCASRCRAWGSPEGDLLAVYDENIHRIWVEDLLSGEQLWTHDMPDAQALVWTETALVVGGDLETLLVLERSTGRERLRLGGHTGPVRGLQVQGEQLISQDAQGETLAWPMPLLSSHAIHWEGELSEVTASPHTLLLGGVGHVGLYEPADLSLRVDTQVPGKVRNAALGTDKAWVHLEDGRLFHIDLQSGATAPVPELALRSNAFLLTPTGLLIADSRQGLSMGWPGQAPRWTQPDPELGVVWSIVDAGDQAWLSLWSQEALLCVDQDSGAEIRRIPLPAAPYGGDVGLDGDVAFALANGQVALFQDQALQLLDGSTGLVMDVAFSEDGTQLASVSWDRSLRIWKVSTGELLGELPFSDTVFSVHAAGANAWFVGEAGSRVWKVDLGAQLSDIENVAAN